jgi:oxygen-independent coproporphyrinogen-3 oxidase
MSKKFGIYVHIPYCLQRCTYCDFATYEFKKILPPQDYVRLLDSEIRTFHKAFSNKNLDTLYFGGGTPSLLEPQLIVSILESLANYGFSFNKNAEITIEINPATIDPDKMEQYLSAGINRFSVGAQTFNDALLKSVHREHDARQTRETLELLKSFNVNFSFDLLFALPNQTIDDLKKDLIEVAHYSPDHLSPYCLTVPESHPLARLKLNEDLQLEMFSEIGNTLKGLGYDQYEISNFSKPNRHSRHNYLYWDQSDYWGIGLSAHSYNSQKNWGIRYWNPSNIQNYQNWIQSIQDKEFIETELGRDQDHFEILEPHQALTDFCHTSLRTMTGLEERQLEVQFGKKTKQIILSQLAGLESDKLVTRYGENRWRLTEGGILLSNQVFSTLTFLRDEIPGIGSL